MIRWLDDASGLEPRQLEGFFEGWPAAPDPSTHLRLLLGSHAVVLAVDDELDGVVGFVTATSDGVLSACIPLLEVLPSHRGRGLGAELMRRMLARLDGLYMVDLTCDPELQPFYAKLGLAPSTGMMRRNRGAQSGL